MIIKCFRCGKDIDTPNVKNSDYVIAEDTKADELREVVFALKHNDKTLGKENAKDEDYTRVEIKTPQDAKNAVKIISEHQLQTIQKTGIVCPECYKETDLVIWGKHK
jgi:ssDNA-binding Zn-finger/Zn-ribbon topoisomerase 1